jgi:hypothetical protein
MTTLPFIMLLLSFALVSRAGVEDEISKVINLHFSDSDAVFSKIDIKYKNSVKKSEFDVPEVGYLTLPAIEESKGNKEIEKISVSLFHRSDIQPSASTSINQTLKKLYPGVSVQVDLFRTRVVIAEPRVQTAPELKAEKDDEMKPVQPIEGLYEKNFGLIVVCGALLLVSVVFSIAFSSALKALSSEIGNGAKSLAASFKSKSEKAGPVESGKIDELEFSANLKMAKDIIIDYTNLLPLLVFTDQDIVMFKKTLPLLSLSPREIEDLVIPSDIRDKMNQRVEVVIKKSEHQHWLQQFVENSIVNLSRSSGPVLSSLGKEMKNKLKLIDKRWIESKLESEVDPLTIALCLELSSADNRKLFFKNYPEKANQILSIASGEHEELLRAEERAEELLTEFEKKDENLADLDFSLLIGESIDWIVDYTKKLSLEEEEKYLQEISGESLRVREKIRGQYWTANDLIRELGPSLSRFLSTLGQEEKFSLCVAGTNELRNLIYELQATEKARVILADKVKKELEQGKVGAHLDVCRKVISEARRWHQQMTEDLSRAA